jgi:hypothetical protein
MANYKWSVSKECVRGCDPSTTQKIITNAIPIFSVIISSIVLTPPWHRHSHVQVEAIATSKDSS